MKPAYMTREVHVTGSISCPTLFQPLLLPPLQPLQLALTNDKRRRGHKAAEESGYLTVIVRSYSLAGREMWRACHLPLAIRSAYANGTSRIVTREVGVSAARVPQRIPLMRASIAIARFVDTNKNSFCAFNCCVCVCMSVCLLRLLSNYNSVLT